MTCVSKWEVACGFFLSLKAILSPETKRLFYNTLSNCHEVGATHRASLGSCMLTFFIPHVPQVFLFQQGFCVSEKELFCFLDLVILCLKIPPWLQFPSGSYPGHKKIHTSLLIFKTENLHCSSMPINKCGTNLPHIICICKACISCLPQETTHSFAPQKWKSRQICPLERSLFNFLVNSNDLFIKKRADEIFYMRYNDLFIKKRHSDIIILKKNEFCWRNKWWWQVWADFVKERGLQIDN